MSKITDSEGGVPPVPRIYPMGDKPKADPKFKKVPVSRRDTPPPAEEKADGYSLADVTQAQAAELMALPLMRERGGLGSPDYFRELDTPTFQRFRTALGKKRDGAATDHLEDAVLSNANQALDPLTTATTLSELRSEALQFADAASPMGTPNRIRRG